MKRATIVLCILVVGWLLGGGAFAAANISKPKRYAYADVRKLGYTFSILKTENSISYRFSDFMDDGTECDRKEFVCFQTSRSWHRFAIPKGDISEGDKWSSNGVDYTVERSTYLEWESGGQKFYIINGTFSDDTPRRGVGSKPVKNLYVFNHQSGLALMYVNYEKYSDCMFCISARSEYVSLGGYDGFR